MSCSCPANVFLIVLVAMSQTFYEYKSPGSRRNGMIGQTHPDLLIFGACSKIFSVRTETDTANIQVAVLVYGIILQALNLSTAGYLEDLCRTITACCHIPAILTESDTTNHAFVLQIVHKVDIEDPLNPRIKHCEPVFAFTLLVGREEVRIEICQHVAHITNL